MIDPFYRDYKCELYEVMKGVHPLPPSFPHCVKVQKAQICILLKKIKGAKLLVQKSEKRKNV